MSRYKPLDHPSDLQNPKSSYASYNNDQNIRLLEIPNSHNQVQATSKPTAMLVPHTHISSYAEQHLAASKLADYGY